MPPVAPHIHEFGEVEDVVHLDNDSISDLDQIPVHGAPPADTPASSGGGNTDGSKSKKGDSADGHTPKRRKHAALAIRRLFRRRTLMQYFYNDVLFRTRQSRHVSREELFLDLVLVATVAALGHHLREVSFNWTNIENFLLLFAAVYSAWRQTVVLWNFWGIKEDMIDKIGIYFTFVSIIGIGLGSYKPFGEKTREFVGVTSFLASFIPILENAIWASKEELLHIDTNKYNHVTLSSLFSTISVLPMLVAAFVNSERTSRNLFWVSTGLQLITYGAPVLIFRLMHRNAVQHTRPAISIEHAAEKFEVLTMIFLGESVISLLFEGAPLVAEDGALVRRLYLAAFLFTAMLYAIQTLYIQVDNLILPGGKHALRYDAKYGVSWASLHMPYHLALVLFATGLGLGLRDIAFPPGSEAAKTDKLLHILQERAKASGGEALTPGEATFTRSAQWIFTVGWGGSLIFSALIAAMHVGGPRAATKVPRLIVRCLVTTGLMVGMPFANLGGTVFFGVFTVVTSLLAVGEFLLVQFDRIGLFRSEHSPGSSDGFGGLFSKGSADAEADTDANPGADVGQDVRDASGDFDSSDSEGEAADVGEDPAASAAALAAVAEAAAASKDAASGALHGLDLEGATGAGQSGPGAVYDTGGVPNEVARALQRRLTRGNTSRMVAVTQHTGSQARQRRRHVLG